MTACSLPEIKNFPVGNKVLILHPAYVAGKVGTICAPEVVARGQPSQRWLIRVDWEDMVVSLERREFRIINRDGKFLLLETDGSK